MIYQVGERTNRLRDAEFPYAVDVPVPPDGLGGAGLRAIMGAMTRCQGRTERWSHSELRAFGIRKAFLVRVGTATEADAEKVTLTLSDLGAHRAR
jgi:hypothetical protein